MQLNTLLGRGTDRGHGSSEIRNEGILRLVSSLT